MKPKKLIVFLAVCSVMMLALSEFSSVVSATPVVYKLQLQVPGGVNNSETGACKVATNVYAFVTVISPNQGKVITKTISDSTGIPSTTNISSYIFDVTFCKNPHIIPLRDGYFAIFYTGYFSPYTHTGKSKLLYISPAGAISTPVDTHTWSLNCLNIEDDIFYDPVTDIISLFYEDSSQRIPYAQTLKYWDSNNTIRECGGSPFTLYNWNTTVNLLVYRTHVDVVQTPNIYTDFLAVVATVDKKGSTTWSNKTAISFNVTDAGVVEICSHKTYYNGAIGGASTNYSSAIIGTCYNERNYIVYSTAYNDFHLLVFSVLNQTGYVSYEAIFNTGAGYCEYLFRTGANTFSSVFGISQLQNYSISLNVITAVGSVYSSLYTASNYGNFKILRMTSTRMLFMVTNSVGSPSYWVDFVTLGFFPSFTPPEEGGGPLLSCDMSGYTRIGSFDRTGYTGIGGYSLPANTLEILYDVNVYTHVYGFQILIPRDQYLFAGDVIYYRLYINGVSIGQPSYIVPSIADTYLVQWCGFSQLINHSTIVFEVKNLVSSDGYYWLPYVFLGDGDSDGTVHFGYDRLATVADGLYNPNYEMFNSECSYVFYSDIATVQNESSPYGRDMLTTKPGLVYTYQNIPLYWFVSTTVYDNYLYVYKSGVSTGGWLGYPKQLHGFSGLESFTANTSGTYVFTLRRNGLNVSRLSIVILANPDTDFLVWADPEPSEAYGVFNVHYRYFHASGKRGLLLFGTNSQMSTSAEAIFPVWITSNTSGNFSYTDTGAGRYYINLYSEIANNSYSFILQYIHNVRCPSSTNELSVLYTNISLNMLQRYTWVHQYVGSVVNLRIDNAVVYSDLGLSCGGSHSRVETKTGWHNATMTLETVNGSIVLAWQRFLVYSPQGPSGNEAFSPEMKGLFGICCILVAVCIPLMVSVKYKVNVPTFVYVIFIAFGIAFGVKLGWLDMWVVFLFIVALVAGAVYTIFGHGGPGPGAGGGQNTVRERIMPGRGKGDQGVKKAGYLKGPSERGY